MTSKTKAQESEATRQASAELQAIVGELQAIKVRLLATAKRFRAAASSSAVVDVHPDGQTYTVEGWTADLVDDPGGRVGEAIDELLEGLTHAADTDAVRTEIREFVERERELDAKIAARHASAT